MPKNQQRTESLCKKNELVATFKKDEGIPPNEGKKPPNELRFPKRQSHFLLFILMSLIFIIAAWKGVEFLEVNEEGEIVLSEIRKTKLESNLKELQEGEQYALIVVQAGIFPCYSCPKAKTIQLFPSQIWKYGVTMKGQQGRYKGNLPVPNLLDLLLK